MTVVQDDRETTSLPPSETRLTGRFNAAGMPSEKTRDLKSTLHRLALLLARERAVLAAVALVAVMSAVLNVLGPRVLGHGTDIIVRGVSRPGGIDFGELHAVLLQALALYGASSVLSILMAYVLA